MHHISWQQARPRYLTVSCTHIKSPITHSCCILDTPTTSLAEMIHLAALLATRSAQRRSNRCVQSEHFWHHCVCHSGCVATWTSWWTQDSSTAKALAFHKEVRTRCITLQGDDFNPGGLLTGKSLTAGPGVPNCCTTRCVSIHRLL